MSEERQIGLCAGCARATVQRSAKGGAFWRCLKADDDENFLRYPPLPVVRCPGYEEGSPEERGSR